MIFAQVEFDIGRIWTRKMWPNGRISRKRAMAMISQMPGMTDKVGWQSTEHNIIVQNRAPKKAWSGFEPKAKK